MIVSVSEAKDHLHIASDDESHDDWLDVAIEAVEDAVIQWVGDEDRLYQDDSQSDPYPAVKLAILVEVATAFRYREDAESNMISWYEKGYILNMASTARLQAFRKPRIA